MRSTAHPAPSLTLRAHLGSHTSPRSSRGRRSRRTRAQARQGRCWPSVRRRIRRHSSSSLRPRSISHQERLQTTIRRTVLMRRPCLAPRRRRLKLHSARDRLVTPRTTSVTRVTPPLQRLVGLNHLRMEDRARTFGPAYPTRQARSSRCSLPTDGHPLHLCPRMLCSPAGRISGTLKAKPLSCALHRGRNRFAPPAQATKRQMTLPKRPH